MNGKTIGALIAGLVIGLAVGFLLWHQEAPKEVDPATTTTRGDWPECPCPPGSTEMSAADVCDEITRLAGEAQPMSQHTMYCAVHAQKKKTATPPDDDVASMHLHNAHLAAQANDWTACRNELDQID